MSKGSLWQQRQSRHLLFWLFPIAFAVILSFGLLIAMGYVYPKAVSYLEEVLALVMNI